MWQPPFLRISSLEAVWPQISWNPNMYKVSQKKWNLLHVIVEVNFTFLWDTLYQKPSHMVKFWSKLVNQGLRYWPASMPNQLVNILQGFGGPPPLAKNQPVGRNCVKNHKKQQLSHQKSCFYSIFIIIFPILCQIIQS